MVFGLGEELLTSTGYIVWHWREYFEDPVNPTNAHSEEEAEPRDLGWALPSQFGSGSAPGVNEICPELPKALDVVGLSWLTRLCFSGVFQLLGYHEIANTSSQNELSSQGG